MRSVSKIGNRRDPDNLIQDQKNKKEDEKRVKTGRTGTQKGGFEMRMIRIAEENDDLIEKALEAVNGGAVLHTFCSFYEIEEMAKIFEERLSILQKKDWNYAKFVAVSGKKVAKCYKYARKATKITIERRPSGFFLVDVAEEKIYEKPPKPELILTKDQDKAAIELAIDLLKRRYSIAG